MCDSVRLAEDMVKDARNNVLERGDYTLEMLQRAMNDLQKVYNDVRDYFYGVVEGETDEYAGATVPTNMSSVLVHTQLKFQNAATQLNACADLLEKKKG